jgi:hypothetical protein
VLFHAYFFVAERKVTKLFGEESPSQIDAEDRSVGSTR